MADKSVELALTILGVGILVLVFGPGLVAGLDLACWFLNDHQCTSVAWTEGRKAWAALPWGLALLVTLMVGLS